MSAGQWRSKPARWPSADRSFVSIRRRRTVVTKFRHSVAASCCSYRYLTLTWSNIRPPVPCCRRKLSSVCGRAAGPGLVDHDSGREGRDRGRPGKRTRDRMLATTDGRPEWAKALSDSSAIYHRLHVWRSFGQIARWNVVSKIRRRAALEDSERRRRCRSCRSCAYCRGWRSGIRFEPHLRRLLD